MLWGDFDCFAENFKISNGNYVQFVKTFRMVCLNGKQWDIQSVTNCTYDQRKCLHVNLDGLSSIAMCRTALGHYH